MTNEKDRTEQQQAAFKAYFQEKTGQTVSDLELVCIEASPENLKKLGLEYPASQFCLWGLLVLCESKSLYFFAHAQDFSIMGFKPTNSDDLATKEQLVCLSEISAPMKVAMPKHKTWLGKVFAPNNVVLASTASGADFTFKTMKKAAQLLERLSDYTAVN